MSQPSSEPPRRSKSLRAPLTAVLLVVALVLGSVWAIPAVLAELDPAGVADPRDADPMNVAPVPTEAGELPGVLATAASSASPEATTDDVQEVVDSALSATPGSASVAVLDATSGAVAARRAADEPRIPASNQKVLTALAVAEHLDPYARLATTVVTGDQPGRITLVAGGDTLLAPGQGDPQSVNGRAGIDDLAQRTARALTDRAVTGELTVSLDTSLFTGPALNPAWASEDVDAGEISAVSPVAMYSHRVPTADGQDPGERGERPDNAANAVAQQFRNRLQEHLGSRVTVRAGDQPTPEQATELARVESAPIHEQAAYMLQHSDNSLAETLARVAAHRAGVQGSVAGVQATLRASLQARDIDLAGLDIVDASGMALSNRVTATSLAQAVRALLTDADLGPFGQGLPVGGASGTLADRFNDPDERAARGLTRAKTGTLNSVVSLSGYVQRENGDILVYSVIFNGVTGQTGPARDAVDRTVAALAQG